MHDDVMGPHNECLLCLLILINLPLSSIVISADMKKSHKVHIPIQDFLVGSTQRQLLPSVIPLLTNDKMESGLCLLGYHVT